MKSATGPTSALREVTYEDYLRLPTTNQPSEIIDGIILMSPSPTYRHQVLLVKLHRALDDFADGHDLGMVILAPADIVIRRRPKLRTRQPGLMFFSDARAGFRGREDPDRLKTSEIAPDLVVEVLSPGETAGRWSEKLADYASIRIQEVWVVDQDAKTVDVLTLRGDQYERAGLFGKGDAARTAVLPGLAIPVDSLFA